MMEKKNKTKKTCPKLTPLHSIVFVSPNSIDRLQGTEITVQKIGQKAFGLSCLPKSWTLPFIVVSSDLITLWLDLDSGEKPTVLAKWSNLIVEALTSEGLNAEDSIIVRSSGKNEGIDERGIYYSEKGVLHDVGTALESCLEQLANDKSIVKPSIPLVVQKCVLPIAAMGHLSNERRFFEEKRDWVGAVDEPKTMVDKPFPVAIRPWRDGDDIDFKKMESKPLSCNITAHVSKILKYPANWGYARKLRLHFEWVWNGKTVYIVQADKENENVGIVPAKMKDLQKKLPPKFTPTFLDEINSSHKNKYEKIRNALLYKELGLFNAQLFILDNQATIKKIATGKLPASLRKDLEVLVNSSLVIRMDIATDDLKKRQLLPRTNEVRKIEHAVQWLIDKSAEMQKQELKEDIAFIFHNFIPAISSAFTYSAPGHRKVQIEALWGLPEGLYYNKHDKFAVDTKESDYDKIDGEDLKKFDFRQKKFHKKFFVTPNADGAWKTRTVRPPYDWHRSIKYEKWIRELAFESRKIAEAEGEPISIMWFIGVPKKLNKSSILPWYHEPINPDIINPETRHRKKTPFDKSLVIQTRQDVDELIRETEAETTQVRQVRIQPKDEELLRDKNTLRTIGELAIKIDAVILLEGSVLSHAYYQLLQTGVAVEVLHPFPKLEVPKEYDKLVRDKIPDNIEKGGEVVVKASLSGEYLLRALREKLIEESFEVLDAVDQDSIIAEIADVSELIDGILAQLGVEKAELKRIKDEKREKAGGFNSGVVLLKTENPLPTNVKADSPLFKGFAQDANGEVSEANALRAIKNKGIVSDWRDRKKHTAASETVFDFVVPLTVDDWTESSSPIQIDSANNVTIMAKIRGVRQGSNTKINVSFYTPNTQLKLF